MVVVASGTLPNGKSQSHTEWGSWEDLTHFAMYAITGPRCPGSIGSALSLEVHPFGCKT